MKEDLKSKLTNYTDNYYFISNDLESYVNMVMEEAREKFPSDDEMYYKYSIHLLKQLIKDKIKEKFTENPTLFFQNFFEELKEENSKYKLAMLSAIFSCVAKDLNNSFYSKFLDDFQNVDDLLNTLIIDKDLKNAYYSKSMMDKLPYLNELLKFYVEKNGLSLKPLDDNIEKNIQKETVKSKKAKVKKYNTFQEFLDSNYDVDEQEKIYFLLKNPRQYPSKYFLSTSDVSLIKEAFGADFDKIRKSFARNEDKKKINRLNNILYIKVPNLLKKMENKKIDDRSFVSFLQKYNSNEQQLIMNNLTQKDLLMLKRNFGDELDEFNSSVDEYTLRWVDVIIYSVIPRILGGLSRSHQAGNCLLREYLSIKYNCSDDDFKFIINNLKISEIATLKARYGENFDSYNDGDNLNLSKQILHIVNDRIPNILMFKKSKSFDVINEENAPFLNFLKNRYSTEEVSYILETLTDDEKKLLTKYYINGYEMMPKLDIDMPTKNRIKNLLYEIIPLKVKLMKSGINGQISKEENKTLKK